jgi:hypothetical protein
MPIGPSYVERSMPSASRTSAFSLDAKIEMGRVCGTSESIAPSVTKPVILAECRVDELGAERLPCPRGLGAGQQPQPRLGALRAPAGRSIRAEGQRRLRLPSWSRSSVGRAHW